MTHVTTKFLDLPDDALSRILNFLLGPSSSLRLRALSEARSSFALATCNQRLLTQFRFLCHTIDTSCVPAHFSTTCLPIWPSGCDSLPQLAALVRLSGSELRVLRLAKAHRSMVSALLCLVSRHCPSLREISYHTDNSRSESMERALLSACVGLKSIEVIEPRAVHRALMDGPFLEQVSLLGVWKPDVEGVIEFLKAKGRSIRRLRLSFNCCYYEDNMLIDDSVMVTRGVEEYLVQSLTTDLPVLEHLEIAPCRLESIEDWIQIFEHTEFTQYVTGVKSIVRDARLNNTLAPPGRYLRSLKLAGRCSYLMPCLDGLIPLLSVETDVEVRCREITIQFPAWTMGECDPCITSFCFNRSTKPYAEAHFDKFGKVLSLMLAEYVSVVDYVVDESVRTAVERVARESREHLRELCVNGGSGGAVAGHLACRVARDVLRVAPNVRYLKIDQAVVGLDRSIEQDVVEMAYYMRGLQVLHIEEKRMRGNLPRVGIRRPMGGFVDGLPFFLRMVARHCPELKCLYLQMNDGWAGPWGRDTVRKARAALEAVTEFEKVLPNADARSVRGQLIEWMRGR